MSVVIDLGGEGPVVRGEALPRAAEPVRPANNGHGDVRKKIIPVVRPPAGPSVTSWEGGGYVSFAEWIETPPARGALLLQPADDARRLAGRLETAELVAVDFPRIGDGRGYSQAVELRRRLNYRGRLRAVGAVTADQVNAMVRVGFDSFELRADQDPKDALAALTSFRQPYQASRDAAGALVARAGAVLDARIALLERALAEIATLHRPALASSLSAEDMVITDAIARLKLPIEVFTLNTGRLHAETLALLGETERRYGVKVAVYDPDPGAIDLYVKAFGADGFYDGVEQRKLCCRIRKVEPLNRALQGRGGWITGQRREQAVTRGNLLEIEEDAERGIAKFNPLADWLWADVLACAARFDLPMSPLYARGYVSIGCEPCTKPIRPGEDPRAGRWWWETKDNKECGLHTNATTL
ncbi:MAG: phosphoadenylyl-sulfate reductase [Caulobacteraceae bacterium]